MTDVFGSGGLGRQFLIYGVGYEIARAILQPIFTVIGNDQWSRAVQSSTGTVYQPITPADLADMVIRGIVTPTWAKTEAAKYGIRGEDFDRLTLDTGEPPPLMLILELYRRGFIPWSAGPIPAISAENAIKEGRIRNEWIDVLQRSQFTPPSVADAVNAVLRRQIPRTAGIALAYYAGLGTASLTVPAGADTTDTETAFQVLYDTAGRPPAPGQLADLVHRGVIPVTGTGPDVTSFAQGIYESDLKDKWEKPLEALLEVIPQLYEIRILLAHGCITTTQATTWLEQLGYTASVSEAVAEFATSAAITTDQLLTEQTLKALYQNGTIDQTQALSMLGNLGYEPTAASFIVASWQLDTEWTALQSAINRVGSYFIARKINATQAAQNLRRLEVPEAQIAAVIQTWTVSRSSNVTLLTVTNIVDAWSYGIFTQAMAIEYLQAHGLTAYDAWVRLSIKNEGPLPGEPSLGPPTVA